MMSWEEYRAWFRGQNGGAEPSPQDYETYRQYNSGGLPATGPGGGPSGEYGPGIGRVPGGPGSLGGPGIIPPFNQPTTGFEQGPGGGSGGLMGGGPGGNFDLGSVWGWVKEHADDLLKAGLIGLAVYESIKNSERQGELEDRQDRAYNLAERDYTDRAPLREAGLELAGQPLPRGLPSLGGTGHSIPSLAPLFTDSGNPYDRIGSLASLGPGSAPGAGLPIGGAGPAPPPGPGRDPGRDAMIRAIVTAGGTPPAPPGPQVPLGPPPPAGGGGGGDPDTLLVDPATLARRRMLPATLAR